MLTPIAPRCLRLVSVLWIFVAVTCLLATLVSPSWAARPTAMKLFPEDTLLFIRMRNAKEFGEGLRESSSGRMARDPQVAPFFDDLYGKASELYAEKAEAVMGISWEDLQKLPQGEVAFAIVARADKVPAFLLLVEQGEEGTAARKLLDRGLAVVAEKGGEFSSEKIGDVEVTVVKDPEKADRTFGLFERDNTIVVATDPDVLRNVLWHWDNAEGEDKSGKAASPRVSSSNSAAGNAAEATGAQSSSDTTPTTGDAKGEKPKDEQAAEFVPGRTLAENAKFSSILRQCRRPQDPPPHLIMFVDPIGLFREFAQRQAGSSIALGFLPMLGLDGVAGAGATMTFTAGPFDALAHYHLLLDNPRSGVLQLLTFEAGDNTPQAFVPYATENYYTGRWNAGLFYDRLEELVDKLVGKGTFQKQFAEKATEKLDLDVRTEIIDNLAGRVTWVTGYEKPAHLRSQKHTFAVELVDETKAADTLKKVIKKYPDDFEERKFGSVTYYAITPEWWRKMEEEERPFNAFVGIMDGNLFLGGSTQLFEQMIAARDGTVDRLADSEDYARVTATLGRETAGQQPILFMMQRAEESIRHLYELITSEKTRKYIEEHAEEQPVWAKLNESLKNHQLPPFDTLMQYYGPGGAIFYDTDNGYHGIAFTLRNEAAQ